MSEQFKDGDWKIVKQSENNYHIYAYDGGKEKWIRRSGADEEGLMNFFDEVAAGRTGFVPKPIIDPDGNLIYRLKRNT